MPLIMFVFIDLQPVLHTQCPYMFTFLHLHTRLVHYLSQSDQSKQKCLDDDHVDIIHSTKKVYLNQTCIHFLRIYYHTSVLNPKLSVLPSQLNSATMFLFVTIEN
jgi:hypothetical protein